MNSRTGFWIECILLFVGAVGVLWWFADESALAFSIRDATWLFVISLISISIGFSNPYFGYASFDRVGQVAAVLILGPWPAALIGGLASLVYPLHRLAKGIDPREVIQSCLHNSGLMVLVIFVGGSTYAAMGGAVPLQGISLSNVPELLVLVLVMQALNDFGMALTIRIRGGEPVKGFNRFLWSVELGSFVVGVLIALAYMRFRPLEFGLMLAVIGTCLLVIRRFAELRLTLESTVQQRTRELEQKARELEALVNTDDLTGLRNRRYMDARLETEMRRVQRYRRPLSIAMGDIDHFKQVNDNFTHAAGDEVLKRIADIIQSELRETDCVARFGGEEFLLCFPETSGAEAAELCERIRLRISRERFEFDGKDVGLTISFGVAQATEESASQLVRRADAAMYQAKQTGRDRVVVAGTGSPSTRPR